MATYNYWHEPETGMVRISSKLDYGPSLWVDLSELLTEVGKAIEYSEGGGNDTEQ